MNKNDLIRSYYLEFHKNESFIEKDPHSYYLIEGSPQHSNRISSKGWDFINSKIFAACSEFGITISKKEFEECLLNKHYPYNYYYEHRYNKFHKKIWNRFHRHDFPNHFVKKAHHKKKEMSPEDINKKDWRTKKMFQKDHAKKEKRRGAGRYYKKYSNKKHRNWEKTLIFNENYEQMNNIDYHLFLDPWMWD